MKRGKNYGLLVAVMFFLITAPVVVLVWTKGHIISTLDDHVTGGWYRSKNRGIETGGNRADFERMRRKIQSATALPGEAPRNSHSLNVVVVDYRGVPSGTMDKKSRPRYSTIELDVAKMAESGAVLVHDGPTIWKILNNGTDQRAKLAFEGRAPIAVDPLPQGLVTGIKIKSFEAYQTTTPKELSQKRGRFCDAMVNWSEHFEIHPRKISVWRAHVQWTGSVLRLSPDDVSVSHGGAARVGTLSTLCKKFRLTRRLGYN